jgi:hypothetical protein
VFEAHPSAALEYWFFKLNSGDFALLVDWIARRRQGSSDLRISARSAQGNEVISLLRHAISTAGPSGFALDKTENLEGDVRWQLSVTPSPTRISPGLPIANSLRVFDMVYESAPQAAFTGWVEHRSVRHELVEAPGMLAHYWGRRLHPEWWWISANDFGSARPGVAVEASFLRSRIWGSSAALTGGYFWLNDGMHEQLVNMPPAKLVLTGTPDGFTLTASSRSGPKYKLVATGRNYADLGDEIGNTLTGDLELWRGEELLGRAVGTACLERRPFTGLGKG